MLAQEVFGVGVDQPLGQVEGLDQEEPPEIAGGELLVGAGVHRGRGRDVEHGQALDRIGVVQRHAVRDPAAAVVADHGEAVEAQAAHHLDLVLGHGALASS